MEGLEKLFRCFSGLQSVEICDESDTKNDFDCTSLLGHCASLEHLKIAQDGIDQRHLVNPFGLVAVIEQCEVLKEVSLRFPTIMMRDLLNRKLREFGQLLIMIARLPKLEVMHIHNWPIVPWVPTLAQCAAAYAQSLGQCAELTLTNFTRCRPSNASQLKLLCFGTAPAQEGILIEHVGWFDKSRAFFVQRPLHKVATQVPLESTMVEVPEALLEYHAPAGSIGPVNEVDFCFRWEGYHVV